VDYSNTTQDSLPVAGQALLDGLSTRVVPLKGFKVVVYISFPLPKLAWRNGRNRRAIVIPKNGRFGANRYGQPNRKLTVD
jgi:hypothetical protein